MAGQRLPMRKIRDVLRLASGAKAQQPTTFAVGEEGGRLPPTRRPTTFAVGEEGGQVPAGYRPIHPGSSRFDAFDQIANRFARSAMTCGSCLLQ